MRTTNANNYYDYIRTKEYTTSSDWPKLEVDSPTIPEFEGYLVMGALIIIVIPVIMGHQKRRHFKKQD